MAVCCKVSKKLLAIKVTMFGWFGASACILPFITVHMKELGLTVEDTTIIYTLLPITQVLFSPVAGFVADKLRRYRNVLLFFLIMTTLLAVAMMYVPAIEKKYHEPSIITILCDAENLVIGSCKKFFKNNTSENVMYLESCHFKCNKAEQFINITWPVAIYRTNFLRECEYNVTSICALTTTILPSNCSIICRELNAVANVPSQTTRKGFYLTFTLYAVLRIAYNIVTVTASTLVNSSAIALTETKAEVGEYGKQRSRIWKFDRWKPYQHFRVTFRVIGGISGLVALVYSFLHLVWLRNKIEQPQMRGIAIKRFGKEKSGRSNYTASSNKGTSGSSLKSGVNIQVLTKPNDDILEENANVRATQLKLQERNLPEAHSDISIHI